MGNKAKYAAGAALAAAAGYVAGILTAPKSGKETRKDIQQTALRTKREAEKKLKALHSDLSELIAQGKAESRKLGEKAKEEWDKAFEIAKGAKEKARDTLSALHEGGVEDKDLEKAVQEAAAAVQHLKMYARKHVPAEKK